MLSEGNKIGFSEIISEVAKELHTELAAEKYLDQIDFSVDFDEIVVKLNEVKAAVLLCESEIQLITHDPSSVEEILNKLSASGIVLLEPELKMIADLLSCVEVFLYRLRGEEEGNGLIHLIEGFEFPAALLSRLNYLLLPTGQLNPEAFPELKKVTKQINTISSSIRGKANQLLKKYIEKGYATIDAQPTLNNGRIVVPLFSEYKRQVEGLIHDESATGQTTYVEPSELLNLNNELRELEIEEHRIQYYIYQNLTKEVANVQKEVRNSLELLIYLDFVFAKAQVCKRLGAELPHLKREAQEIDIRSGKNPLLILLSGEEEVVPFNLHLSEEERILVLSGPNAGGKSVLLKTVGLFQIMLQTGFLVPVDPSSVFGIFSQVITDIGDDQSEADELSTYTAHMSNMTSLLAGANNSLLFLLDEFGAGTDPDSGGKIAAEILLELVRAKSFGIVSTHYEEIKDVGNVEGCKSGAMQFDVDRMQPMYTLQLGLPGRSFAFEVAKNVGLPVSILHRAKERFSKKKISYDEQLKLLHAKEAQLVNDGLLIKEKEREVESLLSEYQELVQFHKTNKKKIADKTKRELNQLVLDAAHDLKSLKKKTKQSPVSRDEIKEVVHKIEAKAKSIPETAVINELPLTTAKVGMKVKFKDGDTVGEIISVDGNTIELMVGDLTVKAKKNNLTQINRKVPGHKSKVSSVRNYEFEKRQNFSTELDVRGKRGDEALQLLERFLDDALVVSASEVRIIHGKGTGVLRTMIRQELKGYIHIGEVKDEHPDAGGAGVTIITFK